MSQNIRKIAIIGAGQMGSGIAYVCAMVGYEVILHDRSEDVTTTAIARISQKMAHQVQEGRMSAEQQHDALSRISAAYTRESFLDSDLIIEAATEDPDIKKKIFSELANLLPPHTILASNTSSLSITRLASWTDRPDRFIGIHFMNPVPQMKLVEIIRSMTSSDETFQTVQTLIAKLGKTSIVSEDFPAFIINRILLPMINEAIFVLHEGIACVEHIDTAMQLGANHPMGPLQLADLIGLDTCLSIMQQLYKGFGDSKYRPCPLLVKYVEAGWHGRKTKRGFYIYQGDKPIPVR